MNRIVLLTWAVLSCAALSAQSTCEIPSLYSGCTFPNACNYNPLATEDDGSCAGLLDECGVCDGDGTSCGPCGNPVSFDGYDYATVEIGTQCWFAENLRTTVYTNGDSLPSGLTSGEWQSANSAQMGATAVYGEDEGGIGCWHFSPDIDACDEEQSLAEYGRLYNWYAVDDARGLCPNGWHVPTDDEWADLELYAATTAGVPAGWALKSTSGWDNVGNGMDTFGFSLLPGGWKYPSGAFTSAGEQGIIWSSDLWSYQPGAYNPSSEQGSCLYFSYGIGTIYWTWINQGQALSVRCLRDAD